MSTINYFRVEYGVKGAYRISTRDFSGQAEAEAFAARWARSNSTGHYWAEVTVIGGDVVSRYNLAAPDSRDTNDGWRNVNR